MPSVNDRVEDANKHDKYKFNQWANNRIKDSTNDIVSICYEPCLKSTVKQALDVAARGSRRTTSASPAPCSASSTPAPLAARRRVATFCVADLKRDCTLGGNGEDYPGARPSRPAPGGGRRRLPVLPGHRPGPGYRDYENTDRLLYPEVGVDATADYIDDTGTVHESAVCRLGGAPAIRSSPAASPTPSRTILQPSHRSRPGSSRQWRPGGIDFGSSASLETALSRSRSSWPACCMSEDCRTCAPTATAPVDGHPELDLTAAPEKGGVYYKPAGPPLETVREGMRDYYCFRRSCSKPTWRWPSRTT